MHAKRRRALIAAVLLGSIGHAGASKLDTQLAAIVTDARHPLSGLSVLAIRDGKVAYQQQFGLRRLDPTGSGGTAPLRRRPCSALRPSPK